ncbi:uncharacterized protein LOC124423308 isoform X1 [Vespa crabro]|uniref:uncharacterized protein LOC124423308 isoform X1 n=1 Tax=Vespa crabro TaxID=7445 RepID=UPI001F018AC3|nr:uncharacterized protein LOC124423308 isoform X1 [Vespa crabro]XP_046816847.1 uncharacterized protein LOC124423308 isoform X1 [Vespa crabro]XP_046816848.1 uncharacterized protein LOC124423308 isoform X1 [Vespa crabro]XP_046816850.1 uncharacterized protein LOC124423308 isoform X1 [Vespa crabro]
MQDISGRCEDVQKIILSLLVTRKDAIPLGELAKDYQDQEGESIPWKEFGYITLLDYLKSMPKYVSLERLNGIYYVRGVASEKSKHVSSLVARQKISLKKQSHIRRTYRPSYYYPKTTTPRVHIPAEILSNIISMVKQNPNGINKEYILQYVNDKLPCINISVMDLDEQIKSLSHELFIKGNRILSWKKKTKSISDQFISKKMLSKGKKLNLESEDSVVLSKYIVSGETDSNVESDIENEDSITYVNSKLRHNSENKKKISNKKQTISMFIQETVSRFNNQDNKLNDKSRFDNEEIKHNNSENNVSLQTPFKKLQDDVTYLDNEDIKLLISDRTRFRLEKLIQKYPNGIWCAELPEKYMEEYNVPLNYIELGFNSVREFASCLPDIFQCKQFRPSTDFILYDAKIKLSDTKTVNKTKFQNIAELYTQSYLEEDEVEALPVVVSSDTSNKLMPEGVMIIGECVGQINVTDLENITQPYIEIFVEEVFTPSLFWIQLRKKKKLFNKLMEDIHKFYQEKFMNYKIPPVVLEKGLNCACKYNDIWHRGIIKTVKPDLQITVMFYDYGTLKTYPPEEIYYLHRLFSYLPAQAIPCGLYNIKPHNGEQWSKGVTYEFAEKTCTKPLIATIVSTDPENNSMLVTLTDTMEEEDVHINDWMVHQNLAVHGQMGDVVDMSNLMLFVEENLLYASEKCYGKDCITPTVENNKNCIESLMNIPLISPQSTLCEKTVEILPNSSLSTESFNLLMNMDNNPFLNEYNGECNGENIQSNIKKPSTNPFLEDVNNQKNFTNILSPQMFMQIWKTNQRFQMQIITMFNILLGKIDSTSVNIHSSESEIKKSYEERLLYASEFLKNIISKEDISSLLISKPANCFNNIAIDTSSNKSNGISVPLFANNNDYITTKHSEINDNNINKVQSEEINEMNGITSNSKPQVPCIQSLFMGENISAITDSSNGRSAINEFKTNISAFPYQNDFKDNKNDQFNALGSVLKNEIIYNEFNETNPFKILLKLKDYKDSNVIQVENENLDIEKYYSLDCTNFDKNYIEINNTHDRRSMIQYNDYTPFTSNCIYDSFYPEFISTNNTNPYALFKNKEDMTFQSEDRFVDNLQSIKSDFHFKQEFETSNGNSNISLFSENDYFQSSNNYSTSLKNNKIEQLINPKFSLPINKLSIADEEFPRFDKLNIISNSVMYTNLLDGKDIKESKLNNSQRLTNISTRTWIKDTENTMSSQVNIQNENYTNQSLINSLKLVNIDQQFQATLDNTNHEEPIKNLDSELTSVPYREHIYDDTKYFNCPTENNLDFQIDKGKFQINTYSNAINCEKQHVENEHNANEDKITNEKINIPYYEYLISTNKGLAKIFFRIAEITNKKLCIFHFENEGWLLTNDFVEAFTTYTTVSEYYKQLQICHLNINFKQINRLDSLTAFFQLDKMLLNVSRDKANRINNIHLMPLKSIITVLIKLKIVTSEEVNKVNITTGFRRNSILQKVWILIRFYGQLKHFVQKRIDK